MQGPRLSVTYTICLHFCFLVSRSGMWGIYFPFISFCLYVVALSAYCASNVWVDVCYSNYLVTQLESAEVSLNGDQQLWSWTISVTEGIQDPESWTHYSSLVTALFTIYTQTPVHLTRGLLRMCAACPTPRLNLKFELRFSWGHDVMSNKTWFLVPLCL
jgi:hypothetical protein